MLRKFRRIDDFTHRLTQPLSLEDGRPPRILTTTLYALSAFTIAALVWGALTSVREVTLASGQIIPRGQVNNIQHLEGGIVAEILVREGEIVKDGQPLVRLQPAGTVSDRNQLESRQVSLKLQLTRLEAQARDEVPHFGDIAKSYPSLAQEQAELYGSAITQRRNERATLQARVAQKKSDRDVVQSDLATAKLQLAVQREQFDIQSKLVEQGYTSRRTYLESKLMLQKAQGEVTNIEGRFRTAQQAAIESENALAEADATANRKIAEDRAKAASDLSETEQQLTKFTDRVDRLLIRAPSAGFVQEIGPKSIGEVIRAGDMVVRIVPSNQELIAEVRIQASDIGHIKVGAPTIIKFNTYDSALYGTLEGEVEYLSATTFTPPPGQTPLDPYYKALVRLPRTSVGTGSFARPITPGMTLQAQIVTGSKSIARYMMKPIFNSVDVAFSER